MYSCHKATQLLSEAQDRPLLLKEKVTLKLHLSMCQACRNFGKQMDSLRTISKEFAQPSGGRVKETKNNTDKTK